MNSHTKRSSRLNNGHRSSSKRDCGK